MVALIRLCRFSGELGEGCRAGVGWQAVWTVWLLPSLVCFSCLEGRRHFHQFLCTLEKSDTEDVWTKDQGSLNLGMLGLKGGFVCVREREERKSLVRPAQLRWL